jgi:uncharacterized protein
MATQPPLQITMSEEPTDSRPLPEPDDSSAFFWDGARNGQLLVQRCDGCSQFQYPPDVACIHCQSTALTPTRVSGRGILYSYSIVSRPFHAGFVDHVPYVVGLVELVEQAGLRILTNIVNVATDDLTIGTALHVVFETRGSTVLPQFSPIGPGS